MMLHINLQAIQIRIQTVYFFIQTYTFLYIKKRIDMIKRGINLNAIKQRRNQRGSKNQEKYKMQHTITQFNCLDKVLCQICLENNDLNRKLVSLTNKCHHLFCQPCLQYYTKFQISRMQLVKCPHDKCQQTMDMEGNIFKMLTNSQKKKLRKIEILKKAQKYNSKLCPSDCEGILSLAQNKKSLKCNTCNKNYCPKCLFPEHEKQCQNNEMKFLHENFGYQECPKCKQMIQKNKGCPHMTCICKYQFCYRCGVQWQKEHRNNCPNQSLSQRQIRQAIRMTEMRRQTRRIQQRQQNEFDQEYHIYNLIFCRCCCVICEVCCLRIFKNQILMQIIQYLFFRPLILIIYTLIAVILCAGCFVIFVLHLLFVGISQYACRYIEMQTENCRIILKIFYLIPMIMGIIMAAPILIEAYFQKIKSGFDSLMGCYSFYCQSWQRLLRL